MQRIYHHWEKWECVKAGFYESLPPDGMNSDEAREAYKAFLADIPRFVSAMQRVINEWPHSCEQFLTNPSINRIAWMGQAAMCIDTNVSSAFRGGFKLLTPHQQRAANSAAEQMIESWRRQKVEQMNETNRSVHQNMELLWVS
jgi:hypothetical protein